jgi:hypothetical protein
MTNLPRSVFDQQNATPIGQDGLLKSVIFVFVMTLPPELARRCVGQAVFAACGHCTLLLQGRDQPQFSALGQPELMYLLLLDEYDYVVNTRYLCMSHLARGCVTAQPMMALPDVYSIRSRIGLFGYAACHQVDTIEALSFKKMTLLQVFAVQRHEHPRE